jgi:translation initiation factor 1A
VINIYHKQAPQTGEVQRVRLPKGREVVGIMEAKMGGSKMRVRCMDGKVRLCRVPGKFKKRLWLNINDAVLVEIWEIQGDERGDVIWKYTNTQKDWLIKNGFLKI